MEARCRILLVEDDEHLGRWMPDALSEHGYDVQVCGTAKEAREALAGSFDLVLLDLGLPDGDGLGVCTALRERGDRTPVVIITARDDPEQVVRGLDAGADDYVSKPFHLSELMARARAVLRRSGEVDGEERVSRGALWVDPGTRTAGIGDQELDLRRREFDLLLFLMRNAGRTWTRGQLLDAVWGSNFAGEDRTVDLHVARVRARIEEDASRPRYIQTVWGVGYRMAEGE